jgi:cell division protein FtsN
MCDKKEVKKPEEKPLEKVKDTIPEVPIAKKEVKIVKKDPVITFTVQIGAFKKFGQTLESIPKVIKYNKDDYSKYSLGSFKTVREAVNFMYSIEEDYPDAFVQALKDGEPIHISEALK